MVAADQPNASTRSQCELAAPRFTSNKQSRALRCELEQLTQSLCLEVMEKKIRSDRLELTRSLEHFENVCAFDAHRPTEFFERVASFRCDGVLLVDNREFHVTRLKSTRDFQHQRAIATAEVGDALYRESAKFFRDELRVTHHRVQSAKISARCLGGGVAGGQFVQNFRNEDARGHCASSSAP
jgi:hypothetical protein